MTRTRRIQRESWAFRVVAGPDVKNTFMTSYPYLENENREGGALLTTGLAYRFTREVTNRRTARA